MLTLASTGATRALPCPLPRFVLLLLALVWAGLGVDAQSLQLTANTQWVNLGDLDVPGNQITVEALINRQSGTNVVSKHTDPGNVNYLLRPTTFEITTASTFHLMNNPYTLQNNTWYHIAGVYDGSTIYYYVNGCPVIQQPASGNMAQQNLSTAIGNISTSPYAEQFIGLIDEVRIWNIARTQAQIAANMNDLPNPTTYPNLRAYYKFSNNLLNSANASFNGTAMGPISYGPEPPIIAPFSIVSVTTGNVTCYGMNNGWVSVTVSGNGVQYSLNGTNYQTVNGFNSLGPGNYTLYVRSQEGCVLTQAFTITEPPQLISTHTAGICAGETYTFAGNSYTASGTYQVVNPGSTGCDSTSVLNLTVASASGPPPPASEFNTGTNGSGGVLPGGSTDATWEVAINNINGTYNPAVVMASTPGSYYNSPWPDCDWISHTANGYYPSAATFFYRAQFDLPCFNTCGQSYSDDGVFCLNLDFFADNAVMQIYVNGVPQSGNLTGIPPITPNPAVYNGYQMPNMVSVSLCQDWHPGTNTLVIEILDGGQPSAFLAQASVNPPPPPVSDTLTAEICSGQTYSFGGNTYTATGQYSHTFQTTAGCDSIVLLDLLVKPTPAQPAITTNSPVCEGATITLGTAAVPSATYAWGGPNAWSASAQNPAISSSTTGMTGSYTLTVTANGCTSPMASANVIVNGIPATPTVSSNSPLCEGQALVLAGTGVGGTYVWAGPNSWTSGTANPQIANANTGHSGTYSLYVVSNGCTSATAGTAVTVNPKPTVQYTGALSFCGTGALLSATGNVQAPGNITAYDWYAPPATASFGSGSLFAYDFTSVNPTLPQTVLVVALTADGCADTALANLMLYASPNTDFEWEDLCNGSDVQFTDASNWNGNPQAGGQFTYAWNFGDGQNGNTAAPLHAYADTGTYTVTLVTGSTESTCADTVTYTVALHPEISVVLGIEPDACGQGVTLHAQLDPAAAASSLLWDLGDGSTWTDSSFHYVYQQPGSYTLGLTVNTDYQCTFTGAGNVVILPVPTISTVPLPNIITPNGDAVNDALVLDDLFADCVEYDLQIMNRWGNLVYTQHKGSAPFAGKGMMGAKLTPGVYYYVITSGEEQKTGTITISY